jgi:hypothetical protein
MTSKSGCADTPTTHLHHHLHQWIGSSGLLKGDSVAVVFGACAITNTYAKQQLSHNCR